MKKTWLVTGSSRGLGRHIAEEVLKQGHNLAATARNPADLADLAQRYGDRVKAIALDVVDSDQAVAAVETAVAHFGTLDVLVNNAGYGDIAAFEEMSAEMFKGQVDVNFYGVVNVTRAVLPAMRRQGSGHIIQISSIGGRFGAPGLSGYQAAKFAVEGFSEVLSKEVGPLGIHVTLIEPGGVRTDWAGSSMTVPAIGEDYRPTVGWLADYVREHSGLEQGDPGKCAKAILHIAEVDAPPLRLILGSSAFDAVQEQDRAKTELDGKWRDLACSVDVDG